MMRHDEPANVIHVIKPLMLLIGLLFALVAAELASADTVRVHDEAGSGGPEVTLGQVAELTGEYAGTLSGVVVGQFMDDARTLKLELPDIREAMRNQGVAVGRLNLQGFAACTVHRVGQAGATTSDESSSDSPAPARIEPDARPIQNEPPAANTERQAITLNTPMTIRRLIAQQISEGLGVDEAELELSFNERDAELLGESAVAGLYTVEPVVQPKLGSMTFRVRRFSGTQEVRQMSVTVTVQQRVLAVVATGQINRGDLIHRGSVQVKEILIDDRSGVPMTDPSLVVNQVASQRFEADRPLFAGGIEAPISVRRREQVEVNLKQGRLQITFTGVAKAEGSVGQTIEVENPRTGEVFVATVTGRRQVSVGDVVPIKEKEDAQ